MIRESVVPSTNGGPFWGVWGFALLHAFWQTLNYLDVGTGTLGVIAGDADIPAFDGQGTDFSVGEGVTAGHGSCLEVSVRGIALEPGGIEGSGVR